MTSSDPVFFRSFRPRMVEMACGRVSGLGDQITLDGDLIYNVYASSFQLFPYGGASLAVLQVGGDMGGECYWMNGGERNVYDAFTAAQMSTGIGSGIQDIDQIGAMANIDAESRLRLFTRAQTPSPGDTTVAGITYRSAAAITWGTNWGYWIARNPEVGLEIDFDSPSSGINRARVEARTDTWTSAQWPKGGVQFEYPEDGIFPDLYTVYANPVRPVWMVSSNVQDWRSKFTYDYGSGEEARYFHYADASATISLANNRMVMSRVSLWWIDPSSRRSHAPHMFWTDWTSQVLPERVEKYWMGCPNYHFAGENLKFPIYSEGSVPPPHPAFPTGWNDPWPGGDDYPDRAHVRPFGQTFGRDLSTFNKFLPNLKVDGGFSIPTLQFRKPSALAAFPPGSVVTSSTAKVRVKGTRRVEYRLTTYNTRQIMPDEFSSYTQRWVNGSDYGWQVEQRTADGDPGTWAILQRVVRHVTSTHEGAMDATKYNYPSSNTHLTASEWCDDVEAETGTRPLFSEAGNGWIPKAEPWYPAGHSKLANGPESASPLTGLVLAHSLVGMEGTNAPAMQAEKVWSTRRAFEQSIDATEETRLETAYGTGKSTYAACSDELYLEYLKAEYGDHDSGLQNYRYRWLAMDEAGTTGNVIAEDTETTVDMAETAAALLADETHSWFRLCPCLPRDPLEEEATLDSVVQNIAPLCNTTLPHTIDFVVTGLGIGATTDHESHLHGIVFQEFDSWKVYDWEIVVQPPTGDPVTVRVPTPWD